MAIARAQLVDVALTRWYHCVTRCVRRAFFLGEGDHNRKQWPENRLEELARIKLVDYTGRLFREGKASISADLAGETVVGLERSLLDRNVAAWTRTGPSSISYEDLSKSPGIGACRSS
jgi:hypothetical protein